MPKDLKLDKKLDEYLKVVKVDGESSSLELSKDNARVKDTLELLTLIADKLQTRTLTLKYVDGDLNISNGDIILDEEKKIYFDGGGDTYIANHSLSDQLDFYVGGDLIFRIVEGANNYLTFGNSVNVGWTQSTVTYDATDTNVNFRTESQKQFLTFGAGNITDLNLNFPPVSGNFILLIKQDGTGSRTITNYKTFDYGGNATAGSSTVKFAGGSNPTLTTDANHVDILSIYYDATNEIAYGVMSLDFQF
tara:strand:+ start:189 stop:935 length:747 start_codon:yes stop_codon:yes gene_type:complete